LIAKENAKNKRNRGIAKEIAVHMPFSFGCVRAVYNGGIYMKFAVFLRSDNNALKSLNPCGG